MRALAIILALGAPALAQNVHCNPDGCVTVESLEPDDARAPRAGETTAEYGLRLSRIRHESHIKNRDEQRRRAQESQQ